MLLSDKILMIITIFVLVTGALMALLVGLVLPDHHWKTYREEHIRSMDEDYVDLYQVRDSSQMQPPSRFLNLRKMERQYTSGRDYPWIVAIQANRFSDIPESNRFLCTGSIISNIYVLTGDDCIRYPFEEKVFDKASVRFFSQSWSFGGKIRYVDGHSSGAKSPYNRVYALKVNPPFPSEVKPVLLPYNVAVLHPEVSARLLGWGSDEDPRENILKYDKLFSENYQKDQADVGLKCSDVSESSKFSETQRCVEDSSVGFHVCKNCRVNGRPLIIFEDENWYLWAMEVNAENDTIERKTQFFRQFLDIRHKDFFEWINTLLTPSQFVFSDDVPKIREFHLLSPVSVLYHQIRRTVVEKFHTSRAESATEV